MKTILSLLILFYAIALPALGELTAQDLEKIRQIVKESETVLTSRIETVDSKVDKIDTRLRTVETGVDVDTAYIYSQKIFDNRCKLWYN